MAAFDALKKSLEALDGGLPGAREPDLLFLRGVLQSPVIDSLVKVTEKLEASNPVDVKPVIPGGNSTSLINEVREICYKLSSQDRTARELYTILGNNPHLIAVMEAVDQVATKSYDDEPEIMMMMNSSRDDQDDDSMDSESYADGFHHQGETPNAIRIVGIRKKDDEPLGMTVQVEGDRVVIARILRGGLVDRQGLLHVGDIILEVNGREVKTPHELMEEMRLSKGSVTLKVVPSFHETVASEPCYMRVLFNYDPIEDTLLPCKELGIAFNQGDVLQVLNKEDPNWWQAKRTDIEEAPIGLIPSQVRLPVYVLGVH